MDKRSLRTEVMRRLVRAKGNEIEKSNCNIYENILKLNVYASARTIFFYVSVDNEVDTYRLISHALREGKRVAVPRCRQNGIMDAVELQSIDDLVPDKFGIPTAPLDSPVVAPEELDMIVVPAVSFDKHGNRLGRGGGYYDRYLARVSKKVHTVGVCHGVQLSDKIVLSHHDHPVDFVVTDKDIYVK